MATTVVQHAPTLTFGHKVEPALQSGNVKHDIQTELYYYKENADGSPPPDTIVG